MQDQLQHQRFERKYFISERQALRIREFVRNYLVPDKNSEGKPDFSYPVHSIYLDSGDLVTYWATIQCEKKRFKMRVRFYDECPDSPLFFEIKRRENDCVIKQRGVVHRSAGPLLLAGHLPRMEHLIAPKPEQLAALQRFCHLMHRIHGRLMVHVAYRREAWVSREGNSVRATIDRDVRGEPRHVPVFTTQMANPVAPFGKQLILELKFTDRFPAWFRELVQHFSLTSSGIPKYCGSIAEGGESRMLKAGPPPAQETLAQVLRYC